MTSALIYKKRVVTDIDISNWFLDPAFDGADWRGVYHPLGAADIAASYVNLVSPGSNDAIPGSAPTHEPSKGWIFSLTRYLNTNITPNSDWTMLVRFNNASVNGGIVAGQNTSGEDKRFYLFPRLTSQGRHSYANGDTSAFSQVPRLAGGIMALSGKDGYLNGVYEGSAAAGAWVGAYPIFIGALNSSGTATNIFSGNVQAVAIAATALSAEQIALATRYMMSLSFAPASVLETTRHEFFLNSHYIESLGSNLSQSIIKPVKYVSNPIFDSSYIPGLSDSGKIYVDVVRHSATDWDMWINAAQDVVEGGAAIRRLNYATSANGTTWARPNVGLVTYDGNTNNNILIDDPSYNAAVIFDAARPAGTQYLGVFAELPDSMDSTNDQGIFIAKSADGINWSHHKTVVTDAQHGAHLEGADLVQRPDGRWIVYYATGQGDNTRSIGAYLSDTTNILGAWSNQGILIPHAGISKQRYSLGVERYGNTYVGFLMQYEGVVGLEQMDLAVSYDGLTWHIVDEAWVPRGPDGAFDSKMIFNGRSLQHHNDEWWYFYCGFNETHHDKQPRDAQVGLAKLGYRRLAQIESTVGFSNPLVTTLMEPEAGASLYINANASGGGSIGVSVLDEFDGVIANYSKENMDAPINSNTYEQEITWDGETLPAQRIKLKFDFTNATLYSYWVE